MVLMGSSLTWSVWFIPLHGFIPTYNIIYSVFVRQPTLSLLVYSETEGELFCGQVISQLRFTLKGGECGGRTKRRRRGGGVSGREERKRKKRPPFYRVEAAAKGVQIWFITLISSSEILSSAYRECTTQAFTAVGTTAVVRVSACHCQRSCFTGAAMLSAVSMVASL